MTARCLCGAVRLEIEPPLRDVVICHCSLCRRAGTLAGAYTSAPRSAITAYGDTLEWYDDDNRRRRGFCRTCGSSLLWDAGGDTVSISAGALDEPTGLTTALRVFTADAADWEHVPDDVPHRDT
jgi:hypothetical protein